VSAQLIKGSNGIYEVAVDGKVVASKSRAGFPTEDAVVAAVQAANGGG
jgi:hypothetical protein